MPEPLFGPSMVVFNDESEERKEGDNNDRIIVYVAGLSISDEDHIETIIFKYDNQKNDGEPWEVLRNIGLKYGFSSLSYHITVDSHSLLLIGGITENY